jgi:hypothetical protein
MGRPEDLIVTDEFRTELRVKVDTIRRRLRGSGFPTSRELRMALTDLLDVVDVVVQKL